MIIALWIALIICVVWIALGEMPAGWDGHLPLPYLIALIPLLWIPTLAIAVADVVMMLQYSIYSVISPEGCASILWKDSAKAPQAADALSLTADKLSALGLVDRVISEPLGGAHRDPKLMATTLKQAIVDELRALLRMPREALLERRAEKLRGYGFFDLDASLSDAGGTTSEAAVEAK